MEASDRTLWTGWLKRGDEHAFEALVRPHLAFALDFARRLGCSRDQADDVLQTCLARLACEGDNRPVRVGIRAWLGRSVSLEARMLKRAEGRRARREQAWEPYTPDDVSIDERMAAVERGIDELTPAQREAVWLRFRHDLDYGEIARILGISENACRLRVHKSMVHLRTRLGRDAGSLIATLPLLPGGSEVAVLTKALATASRVGLPAAKTSALPIVGAIVMAGVLGVITWKSLGDEAPDPAVRAPVEEARATPRGPQPEASRIGPSSAPSVARTTAGNAKESARASTASQPDTPESAAPVALPATRPSFVAQVRENKVPVRAIVAAARTYFDPEVEYWVGRRALLSALDAEARKNRHWLKDMPALRWLVQQGRMVRAPLSDRRPAARLAGAVRKRRKSLFSIRIGAAAFGLSEPRRYPHTKQLAAYPRQAPYPLLITLLPKSLASRRPQRDAGASLIADRYHGRVWKTLVDEWILLCPEVASGDYIDGDGVVRPAAFHEPLSTAWKHYHVDFDRFVLDGGSQALALAERAPTFFAGIVLRPDDRVRPRVRPRRVQNFAHIPVYVVGNPDLAAELRAAGHGAVSEGADDSGLPAWLNKRRRVVPRRFRWTAERSDQLQAHWVHIDRLDHPGQAVTLDVDVVDTVKDPNTIRISADGTTSLSLFLNDEIVDLDRAVRVVINGHEVFSDRVVPVDNAMDELGRDLDVLFARSPAHVRSSMHFGWLYSARIAQLAVKPPDAK